MTQEITPNTENTNSQIQERREKLNALRERAKLTLMTSIVMPLLAILSKLVLIRITRP